MAATSDVGSDQGAASASSVTTAFGVASALDVLTGLATRPAAPPSGRGRPGTPYGLMFSLDALNRLAAQAPTVGETRTNAHDLREEPSGAPDGRELLGEGAPGVTAPSHTDRDPHEAAPAPGDPHRTGLRGADPGAGEVSVSAGADAVANGGGLDAKPGSGPGGAGPDGIGPGKAEVNGGGADPGAVATEAGSRDGESGVRRFGVAAGGMRPFELGRSGGAAVGSGREGGGRHPLEVRIDRTRSGANADWFEGSRRPPRLVESRPYGLPGGLAQPDPQVERELRHALEGGARFPDPRGTWVRLINGGGPADDPFRASNAADCALAVLSTWHGEPATAAPRLPEYDGIGRPLLTGEQGGAARIERWTGQRFQYAGQGRHAYPMVSRRLMEAGHGASAVIVVRWPGGGSHVWNAVNSGSEVIWIDAQRGHMSVEPPYATVTGVFCMILDRQGRPR
ncbi:toxin glutamine deamidase domain-containing protein [Nonomuraea sp. NPDC052265]|uniref:toxin glutamine deamidase domain-containing protein n=1 Tax=Nonomuraea sp. NPDC052265 TaxID=3364374 RepID=UPI0037C88E75